MYLLSALSRTNRDSAREIMNSLDAGVDRDLSAINAYLNQYNTPIQQISRRVNDAYLKSQGQRDGVMSYGRMVDLLIADQRAREKAGPSPPL